MQSYTFIPIVFALVITLLTIMAVIRPLIRSIFNQTIMKIGQAVKTVGTNTVIQTLAAATAERKDTIGQSNKEAFLMPYFLYIYEEAYYG